MKLFHSQRGSVGVIEVLLIVVLLAAGTFTALRVKNADKVVQDSAANSEAASSSTALKENQAKSSDPTLEEVSYTLPKGWKQSKCEEDSVFLFPADKAAPKCGTDQAYIITLYTHKSDEYQTCAAIKKLVSQYPDYKDQNFACSEGAQEGLKTVRYTYATEENELYARPSRDDSFTLIKDDVSVTAVYRSFDHKSDYQTEMDQLVKTVKLN